MSDEIVALVNAHMPDVLVAVLVLLGCVVVARVAARWLPSRATEALAGADEKAPLLPGAGPYRSPAPSPAPIITTAPELPPPTHADAIYVFSDPLHPSCPACGDKWEWQDSRALCLHCEALDVPHFHQQCDRKRGQQRVGCGYVWIVKAKYLSGRPTHTVSGGPG